MHYVTTKQLAQMETLTKEFLASRTNKGQFSFKELKLVDWLPSAEFANFVHGIHQSLLYYDRGFWQRQYKDGLPPNITTVIEAHCHEDGGEPQWYWALQLGSYATPFGGIGATVNYTAYLVSEHYSEMGTASVEAVYDLPA